MPPNVAVLWFSGLQHNLSQHQVPGGLLGHLSVASLFVQSAAEISKTALDCSDALAIEAVDLFCAIIGAEAGHMGLRSLASGGVYICGGIMPKVRLFLGAWLLGQAAC